MSVTHPSEVACRDDLHPKMPIDMTETSNNSEIYTLNFYDTHQCIIHGPALSVLNRMVTLSLESPMLTTSLLTGFS